MSTIQIADKPTLDEILALLENTTYGLNALKTLLNSKNVDLTPVTSGVTTVQNTLNNTTYGLNALKTAINGRANETTVAAIKTLLENSSYGLSAIKTTTSQGCVKSVQRGVATGNVGDTNVTITINAINPSKSLVILNASTTSGSYAVLTPYVVSLTSTVLTVSSHYSSQSAKSFSWQVIEFY